MDDDTYRAMLLGVARVTSSKDLDHAGRAKVLAHLRACGFKGAAPKAGTPGRPHNMASVERGPLLRKIEALLLDAGRGWAYADGMAKKMFAVDALAFCHEGQLHKIVGALMYDQKRRAAKVAT